LARLLVAIDRRRRGPWIIPAPPRLLLHIDVVAASAAPWSPSSRSRYSLLGHNQVAELGGDIDVRAFHRAGHQLPAPLVLACSASGVPASSVAVKDCPSAAAMHRIVEVITGTWAIVRV